MVENGKRAQWQIWVAGLVLTLMAGYMGVQWQTQHDASTANEKRTTELYGRHETDIARLDDSNRNRRIELGDLEERIAILEERTRP